MFSSHLHPIQANDGGGVGALRAMTELTASFRGAEVLVLCYHAIRRRERFAAQMAVLADQGYSILSMDQLIEWITGGAPRHAPAALLTFDGRSPDQFANVVPVLQSFKFPATFFPVSCYLCDEVGDELVLRRHDLRDLAKLGYTIGCHTHTHRDLTVLSMAEVQHEVIGSKRILEDILGQPVHAFCYPYGAYNARIASVVREAGFDVAFTVDLGGVRPGDDPYQLKRVPVLGEPSAGEFTRYLSGRLGVSGTILLYWKLRERLWDRGWWAS